MLTELLEQSETNEKLHELQAKLLKDEIRELQRATKRSTADMDYLKNIIVKYMETQEHEKLLPVIASILQFAPEDIKIIQESNSKRSKWGFR